MAKRKGEPTPIKETVEETMMEILPDSERIENPGAVLDIDPNTPMNQVVEKLSHEIVWGNIEQITASDAALNFHLARAERLERAALLLTRPPEWLKYMSKDGKESTP